MKTVQSGLAATALCIIGLARFGQAAPQPATPQGKAAPNVIPRVEMNHVPLRTCIKEIARQAGINYILDPSLTGHWRASDGKLIDEPEVTFQWPNVTAQDALKRVLKEHQLQMVENPSTTVARILPADRRVEEKPADQVPNGAQDKLPLIALEDMGLLDAITRLAGQAHIIPTLDPKISAACFDVVLEQVVSVRWENISPRQALAALFDNYGLLLEMGADRKSARICIKPETEVEAQKLATVRNPLQTSRANPSWPEENIYHQLTSEQTCLKALNRVVKNSGDFSAGILYMSCSVALRLHRLEDAGFLFYAANIRTEFDKALFPPVGKRGDNPLIALGLLQTEMGNRLSPALMSEPQLFARVAAKVKSWKPRVPSGFEPGWDYSRKTNEKQAEGVMAEARKEVVAQLSDLSRLLQDATYFAAFKIAQDYNLKAPNESGRPTKSAYDAACQTMEQIERQKQIVGFAAAIKSTIASSDAQPRQPGQR